MSFAAAAFDYRQLAAALASRDKTDIACPLCGPVRQAAANRVRKVLRLWRGPGFVSFHCARCGESGFVREAERCSVDREALRRFQAEAAERERDEAAVRRAKALALWQRRHRSRAHRPRPTYGKRAASPAPCRRRSAICRREATIAQP